MQQPEHDAKHPGKQQRQKEPMPAEGPHARSDLTDDEKTPGTGSLPDRNAVETDAGPD